MRIAVVSTPFIRVPPDGYGGTELFCGNLVSQLVELGHHVTLFATGDSVAPGDVQALFARGCWPPSPAMETAHVEWAFERIADASEPYDVVQINCPLGMTLAREVEIPAVYTIHHARDDQLSAIYASEPEAYYVAISARQLELEVSLARSGVIHHGVNVAAYPPSVTADDYVLHVGRFAVEKGTHLAIDAARAAGHPLRLAGRCHEPDRAYYEAEIEPRVRDGDGVELLGEANHARKVALLRGARALLCPIQWEEPFGLIAIESMLCGTPVIGFARGSFPEIVDSGVTGLLVSDVDEMAEAIRSIECIDRRACVARARQRFSAARMASAYEQVFESLVAERSGRYRASAGRGAARL